VPSFTTSWCIGSTTFGSAQSVTINASGESVAAGTYYLYDATDSRSLLAQLEDAMTSAGVTTPSVFMGQDGKVHITAGSSFTVTWSSTDLRDALGFTGNITSTTSASAQNWSTLFWSPTYRLQTMTPQGIAYNRRPDTVIVASRTGKTSQAVSNHEVQAQMFTASAVPIARVWTTSATGLPGEYRYWHDTVFEPGYAFKVYDVTEDTASSSSQSMSTVVGPYKAASLNHDWYNRFIRNADIATDIELEVKVVTDL